MDDVRNLIKARDSFVLVGHIGPDGDAVGSCFGLAYALESMGKKVTVVLGTYPTKYKIIPGEKFLYQGSYKKLEVDVLIALDCADATRLGASKQLFDRANTTVCIDHHITNQGFADFNIIEPNASSTCEIIYRLIEDMVELTPDIAVGLYSGMLTDTGGFKYDSTDASTMEIAAKLMNMDIPFTEIYSELLHRHSFAGAKAKGIIMQNAKQLLDGRITYSHISGEELTSMGATSFDLDGIVEYLLNTNGTDAAMFVYERAQSEMANQEHASPVKISFRSKGVDVGLVAEQMGGGGHLLASGATGFDVKYSMDKALELLIKEIENYDNDSDWSS